MMTRQELVAAIDHEFSKFIRRRDGGDDCHHIAGRAFAIRWLPSNGAGLDRIQHSEINQEENERLAIRNGTTLEDLEIMAKKIMHYSYEELENWLKSYRRLNRSLDKN